jgi:hypothetical protein
LCNVKATGESATIHKAATHKFIKKLTKIIKEVGQSPRQTFNIEKHG